MGIVYILLLVGAFLLQIYRTHHVQSAVVQPFKYCQKAQRPPRIRYSVHQDYLLSNGITTMPSIAILSLKPFLTL